MRFNFEEKLQKIPKSVNQTNSTDFDASLVLL